MLTLDIKDLHLNIALRENLNSIIQFLLVNRLDEVVCVLVQNYFPCGTECFNPCRRVALCSPICDNLAEPSLQI
jgi:hypothetical protein